MNSTQAGKLIWHSIYHQQFNEEKHLEKQINVIK